ncbi:MAG: glycosyltransferase [Planctomycetia bacterium]|nr:glycosyltransferase [Planctomycetia bacterium]
MDVLLLFEYPTLSGGENSLLALLPGLRAAGCNFRAIGPPRGPLADALHREGVELLPVEWHEDVHDVPRAGPVARRPLEACRAELAAILDRCRPDILHANSLSMARLSGPVAAQLNIPSIGHVRDMVRLSRQAIDDVNSHRRLVVVSKAARQFHAAQGVDAERMAVVHNGVDLERFSPRPPTGYLHRELHLPADAPLIGIIGQLGSRKGTDVLLAAAPAVLARWPQAHFVIVGERWSTKDESRRFEQQLHAAANTPPLADRVHFLGRRDDVANLLPELTLLVHPARQEPLGRVLLEAAACGVAVVATNVGGTAEIFSGSQVSAQLIEPADAAALADAIIAVGTDKALRSRLGRAARDRAEAAFALPLATEKLLRQYRSA